MSSDTINYASLIDRAMRSVVKDILSQVEKNGLPSKNHFFISYRTDYPGVQMSDTLRSKYPKDITIVLQHQFWDLKVEDNLFRVSLSFSNVPEKLVVPFAALLGFADPGTKFGLQFNHVEQPEQDNANLSQGKVTAQENEDTAQETPEGEGSSAKIITLDSFRKK